MPSCFGGLKITANAEVVDTDGAVMPGLFAAVSWWAASSISTTPVVPG
jgi:hypothetical protein